MVKLGWFLVPKWLDLNKVSVDNDHIDEMVNRELDYDDSLSLSLLIYHLAKVSVIKKDKFYLNLGGKLVTNIDEGV